MDVCVGREVRVRVGVLLVFGLGLGVATEHLLVELVLTVHVVFALSERRVTVYWKPCSEGSGDGERREVGGFRVGRRGWGREAVVVVIVH